MKLTLSVAVAVLMCSTGALLAGPVQNIPPQLLPPAIHPTDPPVAALPSLVRGHFPPYTREQLERSHLSSVLRTSIEAGLSAATPPVAGESAESQSMSTLSRTSRLRHATSEATTVGAPVNATNDSRVDVEPSVITVQKDGVNRTVTAYTTYINGAQDPHNYYTSTSDFANFTRAALPNAATAGYALTGDPVLDENPYSGGVWPYRIYCAGIGFNDANTMQNAANAILLWHLDPSDQGLWNQYQTPVVVDARGAGYIVDKPSIAVSWHTGGADLGYVYITYTSFDYVNNITTIVVARSTDGVTFTPHSVVYGLGDNSGQDVHDPTITVSQSTGVVYLMWVDTALNQIRCAQSTDFGQTWINNEVAGSGAMYTGVIAAGIKANTSPMARYNPRTGRVMLTWHDQGTTGLNVEYAYRDSSGWHQATSAVTEFTASDQFFPVLDYNDVGDVILAYYDRSDVGDLNRAYNVRAGKVHSDGTRIQGESDHLLNPSWLSQSNNSATSYFIGDYMGLWDWDFATPGGSLDQATSAWIASPRITTTVPMYSLPYDVYLTNITY